ncbi:MAG: hypothetical protein IKT40_03250 [Bacilli bacterium]|nr:hypothetical protein [Bacilli bacterium]
MFMITNEQFKKIVGPLIFTWDTAFNKTDFISLTIGTSEDNKMLKLTVWDEKNPSYTENHFFEDYEEILKTIEEVLLFPAYEKASYSKSKCHEKIFEELDETFYYLGKKCTTYADYLERNTSKDAYIKVERYELLRLLGKLIEQPAPKDLVEKISEEASKRKDNKLTVYFTKCSSFEQDDRIIFTVLPNFLSRILTIHRHQDAIEDILLEHSYDWNIIEKEELFERIDELNKIFKVKKDRKYFENKLDLISENFLVCPNKKFLSPLKLPKVFPAMYGRAHGAPKVEITTFSPDFSFIWNQKPFDLAGYKFETMNEWEAYKSKKEVDEKFEQAENDGNKEKPKFEIGKFVSPVMDNRSLEEIAEEIIKKELKPKSIYDIVWDEFTKEITNEGEKEMKKNNINTKPQKERADSIMFDEENKITVAFLGGEKFIIKCNEGDKFDYRIAVGVACSRVNCNNTELVYLREHMNWKEYYMYCYNKFFYFDPLRIKAFENAVYAEKEQYKLKLDEEKVRKYRCEEVEFNVYKPKKITHDFILFNPQGE